MSILNSWTTNIRLYSEFLMGMVAARSQFTVVTITARFLAAEHNLSMRRARLNGSVVHSSTSTLLCVPRLESRKLQT